MNTFTVVFLCIQACLVQNVFGVCLPAPAAAIAPCGALAALSPYGAGALSNASPFGYPVAGSYAGYAAPYGNAAAPYGGSGEGNVAVAGQLPVKGNTAVAGQVPIMGAVQFSGPVSAAGCVSIAGQCACGCNSPYLI